MVTQEQDCHGLAEWWADNEHRHDSQQRANLCRLKSCSPLPESGRPDPGGPLLVADVVSVRLKVIGLGGSQVVLAAAGVVITHCAT